MSTVISKRITNAETMLINRQKRKNPATCTMGAFYARLTEQSVSALTEPRESIAVAVADYRRGLRP